MPRNTRPRSLKVSNQNKDMLVGVIYREPRSMKEYWGNIEEALEQENSWDLQT